MKINKALHTPTVPDTMKTMREDNVFVAQSEKKEISTSILSTFMLLSTWCLVRIEIMLKNAKQKVRLLATSINVVEINVIVLNFSNRKLRNINRHIFSDHLPF